MTREPDAASRKESSEFLAVPTGDSKTIATSSPHVLPEKLLRCDCGTEVLGVSFYTWKEDPPDWFIEVYKMPGIRTLRWRLRTAANLLLGREVYIDAVSLDRPKVEQLMAFLAASIAEVEGVPAVTFQNTQTTWTITREPHAA